MWHASNSNAFSFMHHSGVFQEDVDHVSAITIYSETHTSHCFCKTNPINITIFNKGSKCLHRVWRIEAVNMNPHPVSRALFCVAAQTSEYVPTMDTRYEMCYAGRWTGNVSTGSHGPSLNISHYVESLKSRMCFLLKQQK